MVFKRLQDNISAFMARDPAARSRLEVFLCYPGFHALIYHRIANRAWRGGFHLFGRIVSHVGRLLTGIEIHPGATVGRRLVIDHGSGVVIGETSEIGDDVTIYQGVTLGGIAPAVDSGAQVEQKRHPTIKDGVIIGSGAQILGPIVIGEGARIGANSVVTREVASGVTAAGIPAKEILPRDRPKKGEFVAYGTPQVSGPDPLEQTFAQLRGRIAELQHHVAELEQRLAGGEFQPGEHSDSDQADPPVPARAGKR
ncbi:MAG: serine O-acetyltransferase [Rhodospirillales bacterium]|jgi:serine O-acetyltransferase|nr:serine O-acetyltransferase [Rhodospirillales bacterium]MDP6805769.1 serine O-acetyltransferase [Rhodospirillales bacterium]